MKKIFGAFLLLISLGSCYHTAPDPAFDMQLVLSSDSMVSLLTDIHLVDGIITDLKAKKIPASHLSSEYFEIILQKHNIDKAVFDESMRYYAFHTEDLNEIYEKVIINLSKRESLILPVKETKDSVP
jgi:hypothetical protein